MTWNVPRGNLTISLIFKIITITRLLAWLYYTWKNDTISYLIYWNNMGWRKKLRTRNGAAISTILIQTLQFFATTFIDNLGFCLSSRKRFNINDVIFYYVTTELGSNYNSHCELCVWPPRALTHSWYRLLIDATRLAWDACGISCQASCRASPSPCSVTVWFGRCLNRLSISSHTCSIGDKSGDIEDQAITNTFSWLRKFMMRRATCGLALSCWKVMFLPWPRMKGSTCGLTTSSR